MKKISEKQNDIEEKLSNEIKITDEEMRRNYYRALAMAFFGFILIISSLTILIFMAKVISVFYFFFLVLPLGIAIGAIGLYGIYLHKRKPEKFSKEIKITDEEMRRNYDKFLAMAYFGFVLVISNLIALVLQLIAIFVLIPLGIAIGGYGLYGIYLYKRKPEKYREILEEIRERKVVIGEGRGIEKRKIRIGLIGFCGFLNIIIGLPTLFGIGLLAWGTGLSTRIFIGITFIPSGILAIIGALVEFKSLLIGSFLCFLTGILAIVLPLIVNSYIFYALIVVVPYTYFPTFVIIVGGILGILKHNKNEVRKKEKIKKINKKKNKIIENSKKVVDHLKIDNSGITQLRLSSVLQIDHKTIKKCLNHLEWLGVIEKKKVSAEDTLFFYKKENEMDINDEEIPVS